MAEESKGSEGNAADAPASGPATIWRRIWDHRVVQWAVGYVALIFGVQHAVTLITEAFDWPHFIVRVSMLLLILGLPIVVALAWYHGDEARRRMSWVELTIISLLLVGLSILFYVFVRPGEQVAARPSAPAQTAAAPAAKPAVISVAVLPFLNLSGDPKEEYFSDGMTEEITSALAKIPKLPVVGRTSAFSFKGKNEDLRVIGQKLGATYLLEGSVRKDGNQVRITAQLIKADTGDHLWTDSYDRELKGIFAVQEDVARAIAAALKVPLGLADGQLLIVDRDIDPQTYQDYLRAKALIRARITGENLAAPIALLEQVIARQPNYAPAWASLAYIYSFNQIFYTEGGFNMTAAELRRIGDDAYRKAEAAARKAIQLDPRNSEAYMSLGLVQSNRAHFVDADKSYQQALSIDPLNPDTLQEYSIFLSGAGRLKQAVAMRELLRSVEQRPFDAQSAKIFLVTGDTAKALSMFLALPANSSGRATYLARVYAVKGQYNEAANAILAAPRAFFPPGAPEIAARLLRDAPKSAAGQNIPYLGVLSWVFAYVGLPERVLEFDEFLRQIGANSNDSLFWVSEFQAARKTERFKKLVREGGLVDYWRAKGWPQWCHPTTGDDFACN